MEKKFDYKGVPIISQVMPLINRKEVLMHTLDCKHELWFIFNPEPLQVFTFLVEFSFL